MDLSSGKRELIIQKRSTNGYDDLSAFTAPATGSIIPDRARAIRILCSRC
jgi:hypothetical protein